MRTAFDLAGLDAAAGRRSSATFAGEVAERVRRWTGACTYAREPQARRRSLVSREDHCLLDLLWRAAGAASSTVDVGCVDLQPPRAATPTVAALRRAASTTSRSTRRRPSREAEARLLELLAGAFDLVVLARYMQVLSDTFL